MIKEFLIIINFIFFATISCSYSNGSGNKSALSGQATTNERKSLPVLVIRSFMNPLDNISKDSLIAGLNEGRITCTADIANTLYRELSLKKEPAIQYINAFPLRDSSALMLTTIDSMEPRWLTVRVDSLSFFKSPDAYALYTAPSKERFDFSGSVTRYTHTGVTAITRQTGVILDRIGISSYIKNILPYFQTSELTHVSNEVSASDSCNYSMMKLKFATKTSHFETLKMLHVNIVELTGNHNIDFGAAAYKNTFQWYAKNGMRYFGAGLSPGEANKPLIMTLKDGKKIAWIGFNELCPLGECADIAFGANRYDEQKAGNTIDSIHKNKLADYIIACVQFGEIDSYSPTGSQKKISRKLIDLGADVVIGSQAHQAQEIAIYHNKLIFYGLGNFLFDQIHRTGVRQAFFLECYFYKGKIIQFQPVYTFMSADRIPTIADPVQRSAIEKAILKDQNFPLEN